MKKLNNNDKVKQNISIPSNKTTKNNNTEISSANKNNHNGKKSFKRRKTFVCTGYGSCSMAFTRSEHLARHIRKHTGEKPFQCEICLKFFSRIDNLKQHRDAVHSKTSIPQATTTNASTNATSTTSSTSSSNNTITRNDIDDVALVPSASGNKSSNISDLIDSIDSVSTVSSSSSSILSNNNYPTTVAGTGTSTDVSTLTSTSTFEQNEAIVKGSKQEPAFPKFQERIYQQPLNNAESTTVGQKPEPPTKPTINVDVSSYDSRNLLKFDHKTVPSSTTFNSSVDKFTNVHSFHPQVYPNQQQYHLSSVRQSKMPSSKPPSTLMTPQLDNIFSKQDVLAKPLDKNSNNTTIEGSLRHRGTYIQPIVHRYSQYQTYPQPQLQTQSQVHIQQQHILPSDLRMVQSVSSQYAPSMVGSRQNHVYSAVNIPSHPIVYPPQRVTDPQYVGQPTPFSGQPSVPPPAFPIANNISQSSQANLFAGRPLYEMNKLVSNTSSVHISNNGSDIVSDSTPTHQNLPIYGDYKDNSSLQSSNSFLNDDKVKTEQYYVPDTANNSKFVKNKDDHGNNKHEWTKSTSIPEKISITDILESPIQERKTKSKISVNDLLS